ncbi:hypothetical protein MC7420_7404 [Coleofasciculus chthonoplastes PCC 7420]|uniref:Uncharacterized protein n=2 Tax=Coleofasciculus TaxID=669368 RepID=B4VI06_9CYAN|nr:hypothetical protein [Coleofasciculus chthonoplastes]EDX78751.1 hypothetical protein MC7420_7404 [Coleofasciculus chthonoplastes PCC 7420]
MKVANPKLTLYAFHLRNNLAQGEEQPVDDANHLWEQCQQLGKKLNVPRLESLLDRLQDSQGKIGISPNWDNPKSDYLELLQPEHLLSFSAINNGSSLQLRGEVYPLQIHDTYAVDITLRYPYPHVEIDQLAGLNPQGCLQIAQSNSLLGQTLVLFAQPEGKLNDIQAFTDNCLNAIVPELDRQNYRLSAQGKFLGSPIFEYNNIQENPAQLSHILIWLNYHPQTETLETAVDYGQPLINLLCCRSKILYTYSESRWCNQQARKLYRQLDGKAKGLKNLPLEPTQRLKQLKEWLTELSQTAFDYANHLRDLEIHRNTIETNNKNYQFWLDQLKFISLEKEDNLELLQQFISHNLERFIEQINTDLSCLLPSQQLFQQMIETIRGIVETEQAESDRATESAAQKRQQRLELLIAVVSTGLAVSGISSQVTSEPVKTIITKNQPSDSPEAVIPIYLSYYNFLDVLFHIIVGVLIALPVGLIVWWMQKRSNRTR